MKTELIRLAIGSSLLLAQSNFADNLASATATNLASATATNISAANGTNTPTRNYQRPYAGEQLLLSPGLKEKLKLTDLQRTELQPIEDDFAKTSQEFKVANQPRIDAANEVNRQTRAAKDTAQIQAARTQLQQVWAGPQPYRTADVNRIKPLLTPEQLKVLEEPKNQWRTPQGTDTNELSAK